MLGSLVGRNVRLHRIAAGVVGALLLGSPASLAQQPDSALANAVRDALLATGSEGAFQSVITQYRAAIVDGRFALRWIDEIPALLRQGDTTKAAALAGVALRVGEQTGDRLAQAWGLFRQGLVASAQNKSEIALAAYRKAALSFAAVADSLAWYHVMRSSAYENARLNRIDAALSDYRKALALQQGMAGAMASADGRTRIAETYRAIGEAHIMSGRGDSALANYRLAIVNYAAIGDTAAFVAIATVRRRIASAFIQAGDTLSAIRQLDTATQIAHRIGDAEGEADALDSRAYYLLAAGKNQEAAAAFERAATALVSAGQASSAAGSLRGAGYAWWQWGEPKAALDAYGRAQALYERIADSTGIAKTHYDIASVYSGIQTPAAAIAHLRQALAISHLQKDSASEAKVFSLMGDTFVDAVQADSADAYYSKAIAAFAKLGNMEEVAFNTIGRGIVMQLLRHDDSAAVTLLNEALAKAEAAKSKSGVAFALRRIAAFADDRGDFTTALNDYQRALNLYHELPSRSGETRTLLSIGTVQWEAGDDATGMATLLRARDLAKSANLRRELAESYASIGSLNIMRGDFEEALASFKMSLQIHQAVGNLWGIADAHYGIGNVYRTTGDFQKALTEYTLSDSIYRSLGFESARLGPLNNSGNIYFFQADYDHALEKFGQALEIMNRERIESAIRSTVVGNLGEVYYAQKQFAKARTWLDSAISIARRVNSAHDLSYILAIRGRLSLDEGRLDAANADLDSALLIVKRTGEKEYIATIEAAAGRLELARHNYPAAQQHLKASIQQFEAIGSTVVLWQPLYTLALVFRARGDTTNAVASLEKAVDVIEKLRSNLLGGDEAKKAFVSADEKAQIFEALIGLLIERGEVDKALYYLERSNNDEIRAKYRGVVSAFGQVVAIDSVRRFKSQLEAASINVAKARAALHPNSEQIERLEAARNAAEAALSRYVKGVNRNQPELIRQVARTIPEEELDGLLNEVVEGGRADLSLQRTADKARGLRAKRAAFPGDAALIAFMPGERQLYTFVATRDTVIARVVDVSREQLTARVQEFVAALRVPPARGRARGVDDDSAKARVVDFRALGEALNASLLKPLTPLLQGKTTLAFLPSGPLQYLPFQVLGERDASGRYRFLIEDRTIAYVLESATVSDTSAPTLHPRIAAFANADGSLKFAETEVSDIKAIYPDAKLYMRGEALRSTAMTLPADYNVLHFATHGTLNYSQPLASFLTLARSQGDDGRLLLSSVGKMANATKRIMVVLSACNTAAAQEKVAGWPVSPALAFLDNGAKTVVASLWKVDDLATATLMQNFYVNLQTMGRGLALRRAQQTLIHDQQFADPYYWGAFVLIGESR